LLFVANDLIDKIIFIWLDIKADENSASENTAIKFFDYSRDGNQACITLTIVSGDGEEKTKKINFDHISGTWYLSFRPSSVCLWFLRVLVLFLGEYLFMAEC